MLEYVKSFYLGIVDAQMPVDHLVLSILLVFSLLLLERVIPKLKYLNNSLSVILLLFEAFIAFTTVYSWYFPLFIFAMAYQIKCLAKGMRDNVWIVAFIVMLMWAMPYRSSFWYEFVKIEILGLVQVIVLLKDSRRDSYKLFNVYLRGFVGGLLLMSSYVFSASTAIASIPYAQVASQLLFVIGIFLKVGLLFVSERDELYMHQKKSLAGDAVWMVFKPFIMIQAIVMLKFFGQLHPAGKMLELIIIVSGFVAAYYLLLIFSDKKRNERVFYMMTINLLTIIPAGLALYTRGFDLSVFLLFHIVVSSYIAYKYINESNAFLYLGLCAGAPLTGAIILKLRLFNILLSMNHKDVFCFVAIIYAMVLLYYFRFLGRELNEKV